MTTTIKSDAAGKVLCGWYALCANPAVGVTVHPVLDLVPVCDRCAAKHELDVYRGEVEVS